MKRNNDEIDNYKNNFRVCNTKEKNYILNATLITFVWNKRRKTIEYVLKLWEKQERDRKVWDDR